MIVLILKGIIFNVKESKNLRTHSFVLYIPPQKNELFIHSFIYSHIHVAAGDQTQGLGVLSRYYTSKYILSALTEAWYI